MIGGSTSFLSNITADGSSFLFSTYAGGPVFNQANSVAVNPTGIYLGINQVVPVPSNIGSVVPDTTNTLQSSVEVFGTQPNLNNADLSLKKSVDQATSTVGKTLTYTIRITTSGPGVAHNPSVTDTPNINSPFNFSTITPDKTVGDNTFVILGNPPTGLLCIPANDLNSGQSTSCRFTINTNGPGLALNSATVTSNSTDPNPDNNTDTASTSVNPPDTVTPTVTVTPSASSISTTQALSATISVSGNPTPTGTVTLSSGS
jgi:uncharacterized repeat protein (TIGR01451 family)